MTFTSYSKTTYSLPPDPDTPVQPDEKYSNTALLYWPVEWLGRMDAAPKVENIHCTLGYWPDATNLNKDQLLTALAEAKGRIEYFRRYRVAKVIGRDAFGPDKDHPVLKIECDPISRSKDNLGNLAEMAGFTIAAHRIAMFDTTFKPYTPHVTVDLPTLLNPPTEFILRPLELRYKSDPPVMV